MDLYLIVAFALGAAFVVLMLYGIYAGVRKMQGHPTRLDRIYGTLARTQGAGVYPPSLRGNPDPEIEEVREVSRGDASVRATPGESSDKG
jgi:hypothetical protein